MAFKWLSILTAVIIILGIIAGLGLNNNGGDDPEDDGFVADDVSKIAAAFSANYSGLFGEDFFLNEGESKDLATANHLNGKDVGRTYNYVTFVLEDDKDEAKAEYESLKAMNSNYDGQAVAIKDKFDDASGVCENLDGSAYLFYSGYLGNVLFDSYSYVEGKNITESDIRELVSEIHYAFTHPVSVDKAKRYVEPEPVIIEDAVSLDSAILKVLGNADGNEVIDAKDRQIIQALVGKNVLVTASNRTADANNDGVIDQKDVDVVNKIIARQNTPIWHINYFDQDGNGTMDNVLERTEFPIDSFIMTGSSNSFMLLWMLGVTEEVKGACYGSTVDTYFKNYYLDTSKVERIGTASTSLPFENGKVGTSNIIAEKNVTAVFTDWNRSYVDNWQNYENSGIDVVRVAAASVENDVFAHGALLCGLLFGKVDRAVELVNFYDDAYSQIESKLAGVTDADKPGFITSSVTGYVSVGNSDYNKVGLLAGGKYALEGFQSSAASVKIADNPQFYNPLLYSFDYILHLRTGNYYADAVDADKLWNDYTSLFSDWEKGTAGQYIISGGMPVPMRVAYAAAVMHPDLVSVDWANALHQQLVDKFFNGDKLDIASMDFIIHRGAVSVEDSQMKVFGNADGNATIDASDLAIIKSLASAGAAVDDSNRMADANNDGVFNQADIDLVSGIIAGDRVDVTFIDQLDRTVTVGYPLDNIVALRSDVCAFMAIGGFEDYVAGWSGSDQKNIYSGLDAAGSSHIGTGSVMSDAIWKSIIDLDSQLYSQGGVGAVVVDRLADLKTYAADMDAIGMPYFGLRVTDPELNIPATTLLGFLCGPEMQAKAQAYVEDCEEAMAYLEKQLSTLSDSQKVHFLSLCMYKAVSGDESQYSKIGIIAGGICETKLTGDSSTSLETKEAITEYDGLVTQLLNFSTAGFDADDLYTKWNNANVEYLEASKWFEGMVFINNSMPVTARVLYAASAMYPDLVSREYADAFLQKIVDEHMPFLDGTQEDGDFDVSTDMACMVDYQQHLAYNASHPS